MRLLKIPTKEVILAHLDRSFIPVSTEEKYISFNKISAIALATWTYCLWMIYESFIDEFIDKE